MFRRHSNNKPDLLMALVVVVGIGVLGSVVYQLQSDLNVPETATIEVQPSLPVGG